LNKGSQSTTGEFKVNVSGPYEIEVEANANSDSSLNLLSCALGAGPVWPAKTCAGPSVLKLSWVLTSDDKTIAQGSSDDLPGPGGSTATTLIRTIGYFTGQKGRRYKLVVNNLADASSLAGAEPRLRVSVGGTIYESALVATGLLNVICVGLGAIGSVLVIISRIIIRRSKKQIGIVTT